MARVMPPTVFVLMEDTFRAQANRGFLSLPALVETPSNLLSFVSDEKLWIVFSETQDYF